MSKPIRMNIRISKDQNRMLNHIGGHTKGFEKMFNFYLDNYDLASMDKENDVRKKILDSLEKNDIERIPKQP